MREDASASCSVTPFNEELQSSSLHLANLLCERKVVSSTTDAPGDQVWAEPPMKVCRCYDSRKSITASPAVP